MNHSNDSGEGLSHTILYGILSPGVITNTILVVAYVTLLFAACVENATVIYLVRTYEDLRQSIFNLLIVSMAVADLIDVCFATTVSVSFVFVGREWIPGLVGNISCKLVYYILVMSIGLSISTLVIMSVDRYIAIVHAVKKLMSSATTKRCIAVTWIVSAIAGSPYLYKKETRKIGDGTTMCGSIWSNDPVQHIFYSRLEEIIKALVFYVLPLIVIGTTNIVIGHRLQKRPSLGGNRTQEMINIQNQKIYKLLVANVALFAFCRLFTHVNPIMSVFFMSKYCSLPAPVPLFFYWICHLNAAVNPIIYFTFNNKFQQGLKEALRGRVGRRPQVGNVVPQDNIAFEGLEFENVTGNNDKEERNNSMGFDTKL